MKIIVNPHKCEIEKVPVNEKEINISKCEFQFAEEITQDYVKEAYFTLNGSTYMQIIQDNECDIPYEVLENKGTLEIGVVAYLVENTRTLAEPKIVKRYNPSPVYLNTWQGSLKEEYNNSEEVTASDKQQMNQILRNGINSINEKIEEVDSKLEEVNTAIEETNNLDINVSDKVDGNVTIELTKKDGTTKEVIISDGYTPVKGVDYYTEEEVKEIVDEITEKAEKDVAQANLVYNALPKVIGSGEEITLNNTAETPLKLKLKGNTSQETTTGKQLFDINGTITSGTITKYNNGFTLVKNTNRTLSIMLPKPIEAGTYILSSDIVTNTMSNINKLTFNFRNSIGPIEYVRLDNSGDKTFTISSQIDRLYIYIDSAESDTATITLDNVMISENGGDYEPFTNGAAPNPDFPMPVQVVTGDNTININNINLFDTRDYTVSSQELSITRLEDGTFLVNGTSTGNTHIRTQNYIKLNGNYSLISLGQVTTTNIYVNIRNGSTTVSYLNLHSDTKYKNFTTTSADTTLDINIEPGTYNNYIIKCMIVKGTYTDTTIGDYIAPQSQVYPINLGTLELCKIGDYQDYLYKSGENWYKKAYIGKATLIGTEGWADRPNYNFADRFVLDHGCPNQKLETYIGYSNYFQVASANTLPDTFPYIRPNNTQVICNFSAKGATTLAQFKTWLSTHNTNIYYILATPTEEQITDTTLIEQLNNLYYANSYQNQTNISQVNSNLASIMEATAVRDLSGEF